MRALSLIAVLLFHSDFGWAQGGFLGVTVFFTLSGFLIGGLLISEREATGVLVLKRFWGRRARRLAPAVAVLLGLVVLLVSAGALPRQQSLFGDALSTATWVANWRLILTGQAYQVAFGSPSPFQHMWSLAIEEQFYLLLPPIVLLCFWGGGRGGRYRLGTLAAIGIAVSTVLCAALFSPTTTERAYFGTETRMAEPLVGVLLAVLLVGQGGARRLPKAAAWGLNAGAAAAVLGLVLLIHDLSQYDPRLYRGGFLAAALLAAVVITAATQRTWVAWLLGRAPLTDIGKISYGGYVYHWPIFLWLSPERTGLDPLRLFAIRAMFTLAAAAVSYHLLEQPIRQGRVRFVVAAPAWAGAVAALVLALLLPLEAAAPAAASASAASPAGTAAPSPSAAVAGTGQAPAAAGPAGGGRSASVVNVPGGSAGSGPGGGGSQSSPAPKPYRIAIVGDSMADGLGKGLIEWAGTRSDVSIYNAAVGGCPITLGGTDRWNDGYERAIPDYCGWWNDPGSSNLKNLIGFQPNLIVIQDGAWETPDHAQPGSAAFFGPGDGVYDTWMQSQWRKAISTFTQSTGAKVMLLTAICATFAQIQHWNTYTPTEITQRVDALNTDYTGLSAINYSLQDLNKIVCPNGSFTQTVDGVPNARPDGYHLTAEAAFAVCRDWLGPLSVQTIG